MSTFVEYHAAREALTEPQRREVESLHDKALAYVWGWQDRGGSDRAAGYCTNDEAAAFDRESDNAAAFAWAYGVYAARYAVGEIGIRHPLRDAFASWRAGVPLGTYAPIEH